MGVRNGMLYRVAELQKPTALVVLQSCLNFTVLILDKFETPGIQGEQKKGGTK